MDAPDKITGLAESVKKFRRLAWFPRAQAILDSIGLPLHDTPRLAIEQAHISIIQGYYSRAVEFLRPLVIHEYTPAENPALTAFRLQLASAEIETEGKFKTAKMLCSKIWESVKMNWEEPTEEQVWIAVYYAFALFVQFKYREARDVGLKASLTEKLVILQSHLLSKARIDEAFLILLYRLFALELPVARAAIEEFLAQGSLPQYIIGRSRFELGSICYSLGSPRQGAAEFDKAIEAYKTCMHAIGLAEVALENCVSQETFPKDTIQTLTAAMDIFKLGDYPHGQLRTLFFISDYYVQCGSYTAFYETQRTASEISERMGAKIARFSNQLKCLSYAGIQTGHLGAQLEACRMMMEWLKSSEASFMEERAAVQLSQIYLDVDPKVSTEFANVALTLASERHAWQQASDYAEALALAKESLAKRLHSVSLSEEATGLLLDWAEKDARDERFDYQFNKYILLASVEYRRANMIGLSDASSSAIEYLQKAESLIPKLPPAIQTVSRAEVLFKKGQYYQSLDNTDTAYRCLCEAAALFEQEGKIRQALTMWVSIAQNRLLAVELNPSAKDENILRLNEALEYYQKAQTQFEESGYRKKLANCHLEQAFIWQRAYRYGDLNGLDEGLFHLEQAEKIRTAMREEFWSTSEAETLEFKQSLVSQGFQIYSLGLELSIEKQDIKGAWNWVQRGKARSLSDLLGLNNKPPATLLEKAIRDPQAKQLFDEESQLLKELAACSPENRFQLRLKLSELRQKMTTVSVCDPILDLRSGAPMTLGNISSIFPAEAKVLCVDWVICHDAFWLFTIRPGEDPVMRPVDISVSQVVNWKRSFLTTQALRDKKANSWLSRLDKLVAPLRDLAKDDEILIFSPTGELNALPLHALCIDGIPVIERQPVIYASSLSVLRHCLNRRAESPSEKRMMVVFGDPSSDREKANLSAERTAKLLNAQCYVGRDATTSAFHQSRGADVLHYHGHAVYDKLDPLQSVLVLSDNRVTAREIISAPLGFKLVTLIACDSATQKIQLGDEPSGLLPAFLVAGADAIVGTLWPLWDDVGGGFAEVFYETIAGKLARREQNSSLFIDLAQTYRESVLRIRKNRPEPYFWALFVLHGNWMWEVR